MDTLTLIRKSLRSNEVGWLRMARLPWLRRTVGSPRRLRILIEELIRRFKRGSGAVILK